MATEATTTQIILNKQPWVLNHLKRNQWTLKDGHPNKENIVKKFRQALYQCPETITCIVDKDQRQLKMMTRGIPEAPSQQQHVICLRIPQLKSLLEAPAGAKFRPRPEKGTQLSDCEGSLDNHTSSDDALTEFEIEETTALVYKWIKRGWYNPSAAPLILPPSESGSDESVGRRRNPNQKRTRPNKSSWTPRKNRPVGKLILKPTQTVGKYDMFCDDSETEHESETEETP